MCWQVKKLGRPKLIKLKKSRLWIFNISLNEKNFSQTTTNQVMDPEVREHIGDALVHDDEVPLSLHIFQKARPF